MKKLLFFLILLLVVGYLVWRWWNSGTAEGRGEDLVFNRIWIDRMPKSETDQVHVFAAITEEPVGIFDHTSRWQGAWELFRWEPRGDGQIELLYPQSKGRERASYRAWKCNENKFDLCLELSGATHGARRYFSQKEWEIGTATARTLPRRIEQLLPAP
ncbi:MAG: hypothetical protein EXR72_20815 [Myxococcales bacterium]|nr:hypothetical protein [Myxococcales bacterium]